jgi:hypothetical protein
MELLDCSSVFRRHRSIIRVDDISVNYMMYYLAAWVLLGCDAEADALRLSEAMVLPQMSIGLHA